MKKGFHMSRHRTALFIIFAVFYIMLGFLLAALGCYGIFFLESGEPGTGGIWLWLLVGGILLLSANIGILSFQEWGRMIHFFVSGPLSVIASMTILKVMTNVYGCSENCGDIPVAMGEVAGLAASVLCIVMLFGSMIYLTRPRIREMFQEDT